MHTQSQFKMPNSQVENVKKIEAEQIRDANAIESARRQGVNTKDTTALDNDDKLYFLDCVPLAPSTKGGFSAVLLMRDLGGGLLEILNNTLDGEGEAFNWMLLGFKVNSTFTILEGENIGDYKVLEMTSTVIKLQLLSGVTDFSGEAYIKTSYYLNDVAYVNRTNEGFTAINNIKAGDNYSNLLFTPKRNLVKYYGSYLNTVCTAYPDGEIKNTSFKNNGEAETNFNGEGLVKENAPIQISELDDKNVTTVSVKTRLLVSYQDALDLINNTAQGFIRTLNNLGAVIKVYPEKIDYTWIDEVMELTGKIKAEPDNVTIVSSSETITINGVGYDAQYVDIVNLQTSNNYITLYDADSIPLIKPTHYSKVSVNGVIFDNIIDLAESISNL